MLVYVLGLLTLPPEPLALMPPIAATPRPRPHRCHGRHGSDAPAATKPVYQDPASVEADKAMKALEEVAKLTDEQRVKRRLMAAARVAELPQATNALWSTQSTLLISLVSGDGIDSGVVERRLRRAGGVRGAALLAPAAGAAARQQRAGALAPVPVSHARSPGREGPGLSPATACLPARASAGLTNARRA